jgi:hypothetical protein
VDIFRALGVLRLIADFESGKLELLPRIATTGEMKENDKL